MSWRVPGILALRAGGKPGGLRSLRGSGITIGLTCLALAAAAAPRRASAEPDQTATRVWFDLVLPRPASAIAEAVGLAPETEPWRLLGTVARRVYAGYGDHGGGGGAARLVRLCAPPEATAAADSTEAVVPLPLAPELWDAAVFEGRAPRGRLAEAILTDPGAILLYSGLATMDEPTLRALADEDLLRRIHGRHADEFALVAGSFRVRDERVETPGGPATAAEWQAIVGERVLEPRPFLTALLERDGGRVAILWDTLVRAPADARGWLLAASADRRGREARLRALRKALRTTPAWWSGEGGGFARPPVDLARVLETVRVEPSGRLAGPRTRAFWEMAFGLAEPTPERLARLSSSPAVDPVWLVSQLVLVPPPVGARRLRQLAFAQRVLPGDGDGRSAGDAVRAVRARADFPALALVLERIGVRAPASYAAAARRAERLQAAAAARRAVALGQFQAALAIIDRARGRGSIDAGTARRLADGLAALDDDDGRYRGRLADWIARELLPALARGDSSPARAEDVVVRALAGASTAEPAPVFMDWEGLRYRIDVAGAERGEIVRLRRRQGGPSLDEALAAAAAAVDPRARDRADGLLAEALVALAYAPYLGAPEPGMTDDAARRHDFGAEGAGAWALPKEVSGKDVRWHVAGSLLALDVGLAGRALRRVSPDPPALPPLVGTADRRAFAEVAALLDPAALTDAARDAIADTLQRGRDRVAAARDDPGERARIVRDLELRDERYALLSRADGGAPGIETGALFSLFDLLRLGGADTAALSAWGMPTLRVDGGLALALPADSDPHALAGRPAEGRLADRVPDLNLRLADELHAAGLPARLAPALLAFALQDLVDEARPGSLDDVDSLARYARELPRTRVEDYVSALAGTVLVPVEEP